MRTKEIQKKYLLQFIQANQRNMDKLDELLKIEKWERWKQLAMAMNQLTYDFHVFMHLWCDVPLEKLTKSLKKGFTI